MRSRFGTIFVSFPKRVTIERPFVLGVLTRPRLAPLDGQRPVQAWGRALTDGITAVIL
jgi:hypothetical protein